MMHFKSNKTENRISLEIGYSYRFNLKPREKKESNQNIKTFNKYINSDLKTY